MIFIDHALKVRPTEGRGDRRLEVSHIVSQSALLAAELGVPVILFSQLKRLENDRRPTYNDLKETGNFEEDARLIILLYREEYAIAQKTGVKIDYSHPIEKIVAKANHGMLGTAYSMFDPLQTRMRDPDPDELNWIEQSRDEKRPYKEVKDDWKQPKWSKPSPNPF